jgi:diaminobutyrate-2-oxoglutarate transaminase
MKRYEFLKRVESSARTYASAFDRIFEAARGARLWDSEGNEFIDCLACAGALPLGHNHPEVQDAVMTFIRSGQIQQALDLATVEKFEFVRELFSILPRQFAQSAKIQFCSPSGSDAVEAAMKLTRFATRRHTIIAFHGAYHGMTGGALAAMGDATIKSAAGLGTTGVHFAPYPNARQCPFGSDDSDTMSANYLRTILTDPECGVPAAAAVVLEVIQGEGGCLPVSAAWLRKVRELTRELEIPLIIDEVQTGFGRTGRMFAFEVADVVPDVLVLSKAVGGGYPLAVVVYDQKLDQWPPGTHAGTFRGNQIAMAAGRATMEIIRRDRMERHAERLGEALMAGLRRIAGRFPALADVRGRGLMIGVEVGCGKSGTRATPQDGRLAKRIKRAAFENGLLIETGGRHDSVLRFLPPLIVDESEVGAILDRFETSVTRAMKEPAYAG